MRAVLKAKSQRNAAPDDTQDRHMLRRCTIVSTFARPPVASALKRMAARVRGDVRYRHGLLGDDFGDVILSLAQSVHPEIRDSALQVLLWALTMSASNRRILVSTKLGSSAVEVLLDVLETGLPTQSQASIVKILGSLRDDAQCRAKLRASQARLHGIFEALPKDGTHLQYILHLLVPDCPALQQVCQAPIGLVVDSQQRKAASGG
uniref:Uncharacterized protein n=1 Tax=Oxyrrhis marina TaxID=2969 RepID=A0A7S3UTM7_OXYMA